MIRFCASSERENVGKFNYHALNYKVRLKNFLTRRKFLRLSMLFLSGEENEATREALLVPKTRSHITHILQVDLIFGYFFTRESHSSEAENEE